MNETLADYLNRTRPNQETIEVATRAFLSELTEDLPPSAMKKKLIAAATDRAVLERSLLELETSPGHRVRASLAILEWAWADPNNRKKIQAAFRGMQSKLPAIESALLALIAIYGMYLKTTGGRRSEKRTVERAAD